METFQFQPIGKVSSILKKLGDCPKQGSEGAPSAWLRIDPACHDGLKGITPGAKIVILTWLHKADRTALLVHPRGNRENPLTGVFFTRSPGRPNPVGLHETVVVGLDGKGGVEVESLEALDGTPIIDIKLALSGRR